METEKGWKRKKEVKDHVMVEPTWKEENTLENVSTEK